MKKFDVTYWYSFPTGTSDCNTYTFETFDKFMNNLDNIDCYRNDSNSITLSRNGKCITLDVDEWKELRNIIK